jgi:hypothetical protein
VAASPTLNAIYDVPPLANSSASDIVADQAPWLLQKILAVVHDPRDRPIGS